MRGSCTTHGALISTNETSSTRFAEADVSTWPNYHCRVLEAEQAERLHTGGNDGREVALS